VLADVYRAGGRIDEAIAALERAVRMAPDTPGCSSSSAKALRNAGPTMRPSGRCSARSTFAAGYVGGPSALGFLYYATNRYDAAANQYRLAAEEAPLNITAHNNLGGLLYFLERRDEAREAFEASLAAEPNGTLTPQLARCVRRGRLCSLGRHVRACRCARLRRLPTGG